MVAMRFNPDLAEVYQALIGRGKHAKIAIIAVMRRLVVLANALPPLTSLDSRNYSVIQRFSLVLGGHFVGFTADYRPD
jgi:hypothetical protein